MMGWKGWAATACAVLGIGAYLGSSPASEPPVADPAPSVTPVTADVDVAASDDQLQKSSSVVLQVTHQRDGDSWVASDGTEYRLGLVDAPEVNEPCAAEATQFTASFLSKGFTADSYSTDTYHRVVAEVFDLDGESLNVALAANGLGSGKYLEQFRHENPELADRIDAALASAPVPECRQPAALVKAPTSTKATPAKPKASARPKKSASSSCMTGYSPCLPIVADLNCSDIGHPVKVTGSDPYRLDRDHDGTGCD